MLEMWLSNERLISKSTPRFQTDRSLAKITRSRQVLPTDHMLHLHTGVKNPIFKRKELDEYLNAADPNLNYDL